MSQWCSVALDWASLESSEQAAWVQAVGSVAAILIAVAVPAIGAWFAARSKRAERKERMLNAMIRVYGPIHVLRTSMDDWHTTTAPGHDKDPSISVDPHAGDFIPLIPKVLATAAYLEDLGKAAPAMRDFLYDLIEYDQFEGFIEAIERSGSPAFYRVNLPDIRDRVLALIGKADSVIAAIDKERGKTN